MNYKKDIFEYSKMLLLLAFIFFIAYYYDSISESGMKQNPRFTVGLVIETQLVKSNLRAIYKDGADNEYTVTSINSTYFIKNCINRKTKVLVVYDANHPRAAVIIDAIYMNNFKYGEDVNHIYTKSSLDNLVYYW
jgi:hypothetical protein